MKDDAEGMKDHLRHYLRKSCMVPDDLKCDSLIKYRQDILKLSKNNLITKSIVDILRKILINIQ